MNDQVEYDCGYDDGIDNEAFDRDESEARNNTPYAQGYSAGQCARDI